MEGNCIADDLARNGKTIEILQEKDTIEMPLASCRLLIKQGTLRQAEQIWFIWCIWKVSDHVD